ncbi:class I SAM-dependent methyltransferase [Roseivirga sp.]|uniref:class I SAM-dependent methyltransferase n=1 Tax=Roseivirga sp. TaxID=1964215 RepID=UPI003B8B38B4
MPRAALTILLIVFTCWSCGSSDSKTKEKQEPIIKLKEGPKPVSIADQLEPKIEDIERTEWQNPDYILDYLGDLSGKTVADVGAGAGYFAFKLARTAEKVIALDIDPKALEYIESQKEIVGDWSSNIEARLTPPDVPNLLSDEVDLVLIVNTYSYIPNKETYFPRLLEGLKPGGKLIIVDFKIEDIPVGPANEFKTAPKEVRSALRKANFKRIDINEDNLKYQYIISAEKR